MRAVATANDCIAYCERNAACQAVAFDEQTHSCYQKSEGPVAVTDEDGEPVDDGTGGTGDGSDPGPYGGDTGFEVVEGREDLVFAYKRDSVVEATSTASEASSTQNTSSESGSSTPPTISSSVVATTATSDSSIRSSGISTTGSS